VKRCCEILTAGEVGAAWIGWIGLVDIYKTWSSADLYWWFGADLGFTVHSLGGFQTNAVLALVLKPLVEL
jgi:hypothetical protein